MKLPPHTPIKLLQLALLLLLLLLLVVLPLLLLLWEHAHAPADSVQLPYQPELQLANCVPSTVAPAADQHKMHHLQLPELHSCCCILTDDATFVTCWANSSVASSF
jgi:hypothetical protein